MSSVRSPVPYPKLQACLDPKQDDYPAKTDGVNAVCLHMSLLRDTQEQYSKCLMCKRKLTVFLEVTVLEYAAFFLSYTLKFWEKRFSSLYYVVQVIEWRVSFFFFLSLRLCFSDLSLFFWLH